MSERDTLVGRSGRRLRIFAATSTPAMRARSCRFITEIGCHTNDADATILFAPDFPRHAARGILHAYAILASSRMGWAYPYQIAADSRDRHGSEPSPARADRSGPTN